MPDCSSRDLLIGTGNLHKARELEHLLQGAGWRVLSLKDFPPVEEPVEDATTFEANALIKARYYMSAFGLPCIADDSGLCVDALGGEPGVYSARYAGPGCTYADNNAKLLAALENIPDAERTARFVCCAAWADTDGSSHTILGTVEGHIAHECHGDMGFGYDPLFVPDGFEFSFADMPPALKHAISHRARSMEGMRNFLLRLACDENTP